MKKILLFALLLTGLSAGAQTQQVAAIRKAYAEAKEAIAQYEKNPKDVPRCSKTEVVSDYMASGSGRVHEVVCYYHYGVDFDEEGINCGPFFITRSLNHLQGSYDMYEEYLFNDKRQLIFYFRKEDDNEVRYYWSGGQLIDQKVKGSPEIDDILVLRYAQNFCNTLLRLLVPEGLFVDEADEGDPHDNIYSIIDGAASPDGYVDRYKENMEHMASVAKGREIVFDQYALVDIDGDGRAEILARTNDAFETFAAFAVGSGKPELLLLFDYQGTFVFYQGTVGWQGGCGIGCHMGEYAVVKNSRLAAKYRLITAYDQNGEEVPRDCVYQKDGKDITADEVETLFKPGGPMGKDSDLEPDWQDMPGLVG